MESKFLKLYKISLKFKYCWRNKSIFSILTLPLCVCAKSLSHVQFFATLWTGACQAPLAMGILQGRILEWVAIPSSS